MLTTILVILALLAADRVSKLLIAAYLAQSGPVVLIPKLLGLRLLEGGNTGAAFGIFQGRRFLLVVLTGAVLLVLLYALLFKRFKSPVLKWSVMLIVAGGIGNLYDRIVYGSVTDFFELLFMDFPLFNVADCLITVGAVMGAVYLLVSCRDDAIFVRDEPNKPANKGEADG